MPAWVTDDEGTEAFGPLAVGHEVGGLNFKHVTAGLGRGISQKMGEKMQSVFGHMDLFKIERASCGSC